jgi:peroxiredoxin
MKALLALFVLVLSPNLSFAEAVVGQAAPAFKVKDASGKEQSLQNYTGQWVVLEWYNKDCPFVKKHYGSGNMQSLQRSYGGNGVKWLTVISSAPGKQGYLEPAQAEENAKQVGSAAAAVLIDSTGAMGQAYGAKTTPHIFIIDPKGKLIYAGAIDDNSSADPAVIPNSKNYVITTLDAAMAGKPVAVASSQPYGCSVKY